MGAMSILLKPIKARRVSDQAFEQIRDLVFRGQLKPGDQLMPERGLAQAMGVLDGDTLFTLATGKSGKQLSMLLLGTMAAEVTARATVRAVLAAQRLRHGGLDLPCAADLPV